MSTNDTKLRGITDEPDGCAACHPKDLYRLEKWADGNVIKLNEKKYKVLHLGKKNPTHAEC